MTGNGARRYRAGERGSATVWTALVATTLCAVFGAVLALGQAVVARHRAGAAADLAALAAAGHALRGPADACALAVAVAAAQGAEVVRCALSGEVADVTARARFGPYAPAVRARAGPPQPPARPGLPAPGSPAPGLPAPGPAGPGSPTAALSPPAPP
jgi:secretion/DNA translocation related TadE-like protein